MKRKTYNKYSWFPCILLMTIFFVNDSLICGQGITDEKPNIIFILTDDQRWDALGYAGNELVYTPEMDKLAGEGAYFRHAFVTTPICAASRASFFTGLYERSHRYTFQVVTADENQMRESYSKILMDNGYYTGFFGKYGVRYENKARYFDVFDDYDRNNEFDDHKGYFYKTIDGDTVHLTRYTGHQALEFIENAPRDKPYCLSLSFSAPHAHDRSERQYFWQESVDHLLQDIEIPDPDLKHDEYFKMLPLPVQQGMNRQRWYWRFNTPDKYQYSVKGYYRMISGIDREIGKIRSKLKELGQDKNTIIILMGDNGYFLGERQLAGKWLMYDNSIRVPLVIYDPRVGHHRYLESMALNIDIPATMIDLAGVEIPANWQGMSLLPLVEGKTNILDRDTILIEHLWERDDLPSSEGVRTNEWKYLRYINDKNAEELYHLKSDPGETRNRAEDPSHEEILQVLRGKCDQLIKKYHDPVLGLPGGLQVAINRGKASYSWTLPGKGTRQRAFQVLVAYSIESLEKNHGAIWDSRRVDTTSHQGIVHQGQELEPGKTYYWKVRIWDQDNRLTEYSEISKINT